MPAIEQPRVFLVVVDETEEHRLAVRYAARRAAHTGGKLALLYVIEPAELPQLLAIEELSRADRRGTRDGAVAKPMRRHFAGCRLDADRLHPGGAAPRRAVGADQ